MNSREQILKAIAANQPALTALPEMDLALVLGYEDLFAQFKNVLEGIGGKVEILTDLQPLTDALLADKASGDVIINTVTALGKVDEGVANLSSVELEKVERAYLKGAVAVAENGAVWLYESQMVNRLLPFACQHLVLLIYAKDLVATMHQAYAKVDVAKEGFGAFIAGPSKTADIEQSLVIGAHGARSATIYILK